MFTNGILRYLPKILRTLSKKRLRYGTIKKNWKNDYFYNSNPILDGDFCHFDHRCLSSHCHVFRCKGLPKVNSIEKFGKCKNDDDCHHEQFCRKSKCEDRKNSGRCKNDSECLSNHCATSICKPIGTVERKGTVYS